MKRTVKRTLLSFGLTATVFATLVAPALSYEYPESAVTGFVKGCYQGCTNGSATAELRQIPEMNNWMQNFCKQTCTCQIVQMQESMTLNDVVDYQKALASNTQADHPNHEFMESSIQQCIESNMQKFPPPSLGSR